MISFKKIVSLAVAAFFLALAPVSVVKAQATDRCNDYANQMMSFDQRARQMNCGWNKPRFSYQQFYDWCSKNSASATQDQINTWGSDFQRCQFQASGSPAAQPARPVAQPTLQSGSYNMNSGNFEALVTLSVQGATISGQSSWKCCPSPRIDPIIEGRIANGNVTFVRDCRGQGYVGACRQTYTGVISGNSVSGTWSGTGQPPGGGRWSMRLR
jgi:hypothetical protein